MMLGEPLKSLSSFPLGESLQGSNYPFLFPMYLFMHFPSATIRIQASGIPAWLKRMSVKSLRKIWSVAQ